MANTVDKHCENSRGGGFDAFYPRIGSAYSVGGVCVFRETHHPALPLEELS